MTRTPVKTFSFFSFYFPQDLPPLFVQDQDLSPTHVSYQDTAVPVVQAFDQVLRSGMVENHAESAVNIVFLIILLFSKRQ